MLMLVGTAEPSYAMFQAFAHLRPEDARWVGLLRLLLISVVAVWLLCAAALASAIGLGRAWRISWLTTVGFYIGFVLTIVRFPNLPLQASLFGSLWCLLLVSGLFTKESRSYFHLEQSPPLLLTSVPVLVGFCVSEAILRLASFMLSVDARVEALRNV